METALEHLDVVIVGAGLSGIGAAYRVATGLPGKSFTVLEARGAIGGTWDLFRYPGIRSDSDMYTLGFPFRPWTGDKAIADGRSIRTYVEDTAREFGIDRRIRFLTKRLDIAEVADPSAHHGSDQVFFGATVTYANAAGEERTVTIKGIDEADNLAGEVSWISPIARALLKAREGDEVQLVTPGGVETIEVVEVRYPNAG